MLFRSPRGLRQQRALQDEPAGGIPCPECPDGSSRSFAFTDEEAALLQAHGPRVVVADGCSASTAVLHLASSVLSDLGMPVGTICDTPKAQLDQHKMWDCKKGTPSTDEIMRCNNNAYCEADDAADVVESSLEVVRAEGDRSGTSDMDSDDPNSEGASRQYAITIAPNSTLAFWVVYEPRRAGLRL